MEPRQTTLIRRSGSTPRPTAPGGGEILFLSSPAPPGCGWIGLARFRNQRPDLAGKPVLILSGALDPIVPKANAEALAADGRFSAVFTLPELNAYHIGELLYLLALSVAYEGELANVDAFDQPGVEGYKRLLGPKLQELKK